jgi:hypothetical protein
MNADQFFKNHEEKPFHSNEYARTSRGDTIGSSSAQTFGQRTHIERTRSAVQRYGNSHIGQGYIHRSGTPGAGATNHLRTSGGARMNSRDGAAAPPRVGGMQPPARQSFSEPPARHNPYQ